MARDYAARCPVSPVRSTWLVAAAILLAAQGKAETTRANPLQFPSTSIPVRTDCGRPEPCLPRPASAARPPVSRLRVASGCGAPDCEPSCKSLLSKHTAESVRGVSLRHDTRGVALLVCGFCPKSSQLQTAGDCSGSLIPSEPLQTLPTRLTCNLCLPVGKRGREMGRNRGSDGQPVE